MGAYIARRVLSSIPVLFLVVTGVFFAFQLIPSDPARAYLGPEATPETVEVLRRELGLDKPMIVQYVNYLKRLARGDLGKSISTRRLVVKELGSPFVNTIKLSIASIILATVVGVLLGTVAAVRQGTFWDHLASVVALLGISIPVFWLGLLMMYFFSVQLHLLPSAGDYTWKHYFMPTVALAVFSLAFIARMTRSSLLEVIRQDYVRTARAKGLAERRVINHHALRNALLPIITLIALSIPAVLNGAVLTETVFSWPGMGLLLFQAILGHDFNVAMAVLLFLAVTTVLFNLLADLAYALVDPRIRYA